MYSSVISDLMKACQWDTTNFLIVSENVFDPLIYYSHVIPLVIALTIGSFILFKNSKQLISRILFVLAVLFSLWILFDLILWATDKPHLIMFFWSVLNLIEPFIYAAGLYFVQVFITGKDTSVKNKILLSLPLVPLVFLIPTKLTLLGFNLSNCDREAIEGPLTHYAYLVEVFYILGIVVFAMGSYHRTRDFLVRKKSWLATIGVVLFLLTFSAANLIGTITNDWRVPQWGLFVMSAFLIFLSYLAAKYHSPDFKLLAAQAVSVALSILIGSQFFLVSTPGHRILTVITFLLSIAAAVLISREVRKMAGSGSEDVSPTSSSVAVEGDITVNNEPIERSSKITLAVLVFSILLVMFTSAYRFLWTKNYDFSVETECGPDAEVCFVRDCEAEECPPNGLEQYRQFYLSAKDFYLCGTDSCLTICVDGGIECEELVCDSEIGDSCAVPSQIGSEPLAEIEPVPGSDLEPDQIPMGEENPSNL